MSRAQMAWPLALLASLALVGCGPAPEAPRDDRQLVRAVPVEQGRLRHHLAFSGVLLSVDRAQLSFQSAGRLETRPAVLGQAVQPGELLATLENPELGPAQRAALAALRETIARRDQARRDLERSRSLAETGAVGEERVEQLAAQLDTLDAAVARAEAELAGTRQRVEDATLLAPFRGVISRIAAEPGEFVAAGQPVLSIGGLDRLELEVGVPASLAVRLAPGDAVEVRIPQLADRVVPGRITELAAIGDAGNGLFPVLVEVDATTEPELRAGMHAEALVDYADVQGLIVPLSAIVDPVGGAPRVYRLEDGVVREVPIEVLAAAAERVAVRPRDGGRLAEGDPVVTAGHRALTDGQPVRAVP